MPVVKCYTTAEAARYMALAPETLATWRLRGVGPAYIRIPNNALGRGPEKRPTPHGIILYPIYELDSWFKQWMVAAGRLPRPRPGPAPGTVYRGKPGPRRKAAKAPGSDSAPAAPPPDDLAALEARVAALQAILAEHGIPAP
jgi:hypothetical protein